MPNNYCQHCGGPLASDANFCSECGEAVTDSDGWGEASAASETSDWSDGERTPAANDWGRRSERAGEPDTTIAAITHVLALVTWVIGPLIVLVATDDEFVAENARNALNWQLVFAIYMVLSGLLAFVLVGFLFLVVLPILDLVVCIVAAIKASEGEAWTYPLTPDLV